MNRIRAVMGGALVFVLALATFYSAIAADQEAEPQQEEVATLSPGDATGWEAIETTTTTTLPPTTTTTRPKPVATTRAPQPARTVQAPSGDVWAALRQCESGGNYQANTGNGYYGAYQFSASTWRSMGTGYAYAHEAPPAVQDDAARRLQARSGWGQWPACSRKIGVR